MKTYQYVLIGVFSFLFFLLSSIPASVVYPYWKDMFGNKVPVEMNSVAGSVWDGQAGILKIQKHQLQKVQWDFSVLSLILGQLKVDWGFSLGDGQATGSMGKSFFGGITVSDVDAVLPMKDLLSLFDMQSLSADGFLKLKINELSVDGGAIVSALGNVEWQDAEIAIFKPLKLGDLEMNFEPDENGVKGILRDKGGPLETDGLLTLNTNGEYRFTGAIRVRDPSKKDLNSAVNSLGRAGPDGKITIKYSGKLQPLSL